MNRRVFYHTLLAAIVAGSWLSAPLAVDAKPKLLPSCWGMGCAPKAKEVFDPEAQLLIDKLSHDPSLMNVEYLKYFIGRPKNERHQKGSTNPHYYWYDANDHVTYQLEQQMSGPGQVVGAQMLVPLHGFGLTFEKAEKLYGPPAKRFYDYQARPAEVFTFAPNTFVSFSSKPNTFRCDEAKIIYNGPPLPPPSSLAMAEAEAALVAKSELASTPEQFTPEAIPVLEARVKNKPLDAEAHLQLADAYRRQSQLHAAIGEYKTALAVSGSNAAVRDQSIAALRQLRVIDDQYDPTTTRHLELVHSGQALKATHTQPAAGSNRSGSN